MKIIELSKTQVTMVDDEDLEFLSSFTWHAAKTKKGSHYARTIISEKHLDLIGPLGRIGDYFKYRQYIALHQLLFAIPKGYTIDHIDRDPSNNQKYNLRVCTHTQNSYNKSIQKTKKYKGISTYRSMYDGYPDTHRVYVQGSLIATIKGDEEKAARAYDIEAIKRFGEFACTNFPREEYAVHSIST